MGYSFTKSQCLVDHADKGEQEDTLCIEFDGASSDTASKNRKKGVLLRKTHSKQSRRFMLLALMVFLFVHVGGIKCIAPRKLCKAHFMRDCEAIRKRCFEVRIPCKKPYENTKLFAF